MENSIKISDKEKIFGFQERGLDSYLLNVALFNTKLVIYKRRPEGGDLNLTDVLRSMYTEMPNDEYDCETKLKPDLFENRWRKCRESLLREFA